MSNSRPVLGDVTNRIPKRGFSLISANSGTKSNDVCSENFKSKEQISKFSNHSSRGEDNSKRSCISPSICSEINSLKGNNVSSISKIQMETKNPNLSNLGDRDGCVLDKDLIVKNKDENENKEEEGISSDANLDELDSIKSGSLELLRLPESQESRSSGLEKCVGFMGYECSDSNAGVDLIKSCSCSFCTKAAYIWSDLHYQDIKGRIAALKKSQKEANVLVQRSLRSHGIESNKISKVESDLMGQWRSLFLHMEDIFSRESSQLEGSLFTLKDLRDNCKTELDSTNGSSSSGKQ